MGLQGEGQQLRKPRIGPRRTLLVIEMEWYRVDKPWDIFPSPEATQLAWLPTVCRDEIRKNAHKKGNCTVG